MGSPGSGPRFDETGETDLRSSSRFTKYLKEPDQTGPRHHYIPLIVRGAGCRLHDDSCASRAGVTRFPIHQEQTRNPLGPFRAGGKKARQKSSSQQMLRSSVATARGSGWIWGKYLRNSSSDCLVLAEAQTSFKMIYVPKYFQNYSYLLEPWLLLADEPMATLLRRKYSTIRVEQKT